ncbi:hypothetical protein H311_03111 [Anncaliia algerae PRA109]|nr:hypothetical protein H311_03111 [Anncaliia algerae PRA109]
MCLLSDLCYEYTKQGLFFSALSLGEYLYNKIKSIDVLYDIIVSMYNLNYTGQVIKIFEQKKEIQNIFELRKIYFKCLKKQLIIKLDDNLSDYKREQKNEIKLKNKSILKLYENTSKNKSNNLVEAFQLDNKNLEALILLHKNSLVSQGKIHQLIDSMEEKELIEVYTCIFSEKNYLTNIYSPLTFFKLAKELYYEKNSDQLFLLGTSLVEGYNQCEYSYFILGMYFLLKNELNDAKACFYQSLKLNDNFGDGWIAYGIVNSTIKECMNAANCFENAYEKMPGSFKPSLYLGYEYHKMNNQELADLWYKKTLEMEVNSVVVQKYSSFLISHDRIDEAMSLLQYKNTPLEDKRLQNDDLLNYLKIFCLILKNNLNEAESLLKDTKESWRTYALYGFIRQIQNNLEDSIMNYHESLIRNKKNGFIEDILTHALEVNSDKNINSVMEYSNLLFEALDLKSLGIVFI